jgi:hypothetical protein
LLGIDPSTSFAEKLDELVSAGHIRVAEKDRLQTLVDAGNASAHRGWQPTADDLDTMMSILEHFVEDSFIAPARRNLLDEQAKKIKAKVPPRISRKRTKTISGTPPN